MRNEQTIEADKSLVEVLRKLGRRSEPVPDEVGAAAIRAYTLRTVDTQLAALTFDSVFDSDIRAGAPNTTVPRRLRFVGRGLSVELEVADHALRGRLVPPGPARIEVRGMVPEPGECASVTADDRGYFVLPAAPTGPFSLRCQRRPIGSAPAVITDWVTL